MSAPEPTAPPEYTARGLLREIQRRDGRVYRLPLNSVFVLTSDAEVAEWLKGLGARSFTPAGADVGVDGGYWRAPGVREWDLYIHTIPVRGEQTIHEAAKLNKNVEYETV